jgi:hypothetical protein
VKGYINDLGIRSAQGVDRKPCACGECSREQAGIVLRNLRLVSRVAESCGDSLTQASATTVELMAEVQMPFRVLAMPPLRRCCQARVVPGSRAAKVALPRQCDGRSSSVNADFPAPATSTDRQRGLNGMPIFPWPPGAAPEGGMFAGSKRLVLVH